MDSNTTTVAPSGVQAFLTKLAVFIQQNKFALIILCVLGLGVCLFMMTRGTKEEIKKKSAFVVYRKRFQMYLKKMYVWVMHVAERIPVLGSLIGNICYGYKCQEALTEDDAVLRTGKVLWWMLVSFISAFVFGMAWFKDITLSLITAFILAHVVMTSLKSNSRKYLIGLNDAVEDFLLAYHKSSGNIDEAFYAVIRSRNQVSRHFEIMHEYIKRAYVSDNSDYLNSNEFPKDKKCYIDWCNENLQDRWTKECLGAKYAEVLYGLRCDIVHAGCANIHADGKAVYLFLGDNSRTTEFTKYRVIDIATLCEVLFSYADTWSENFGASGFKYTRVFDSNSRDDVLLYNRLCDEARADYLKEQFDKENSINDTKP